MPIPDLTKYMQVNSKLYILKSVYRNIIDFKSILIDFFIIFFTNLYKTIALNLLVLVQVKI